jgi:hypothetical protein
VSHPPVFWRDDGHMTGDAVAAVADGELDDPGVLAHAAACDACLQAVGVAAIRSHELGELLAALRRERAVSLARPRRRVSLAAAVAMTAALGVLAFTVGRLSAATPALSAAPALPSPPATLATWVPLALELPAGLGAGLPARSAGDWPWRLGDCVAGGPPR